MDTSRQVYEADATGAVAGVYADVQQTFRAPVVNWIFRTLAANDPEVTRLLWAQVKPIFGTRAFGEFTVDWRDAVLSAVEDDAPRYRASDVDVSPAEWREMRGQLATFDVVVPRLAVFFEVVHRSLRGEAVGSNPRADRAATEPLPPWLDRDRGRAPTMAAFDDPPSSVRDEVEAIQRFHGFESGLPSIYRCLVQWPSLLRQVWADTEPVLASDAFDAACEAAGESTGTFVEELAYRPRLTPADLANAGVADATVTALDDLFADFARGPVETVLPAVPVFAASVGAAGERGRLG